MLTSIYYNPFVSSEIATPNEDFSRAGFASVETYDYAIEDIDTLPIIVDITVLWVNVIRKFFRATKNVAIWELILLLPKFTIILSHGMSDFTRWT